MHMNGSGFVYEIGELTGICLIKSTLDPKQDQNDEDGGIAVHFLHGLVVWWFPEDKQKKQFSVDPGFCPVVATTLLNYEGGPRKFSIARSKLVIKL